MDRQTQIDNLDTILSYIRVYERRMAGKMPEYYKLFSFRYKWVRQCEINKKCLDFWHRKFNRILNELKY